MEVRKTLSDKKLLLIEKLKENKGATDTYIIGLVIIIGIALIFAVAIEYHRGTIILEGVKDHMNRAAISTATSNAYNAYTGVREGNSSLYSTTGGNVFYEFFSTTDIQNNLISSLHATQDSTTVITKYRSGMNSGYEYKIYDIIVTIENPNFNAAFGEKCLFKVEYKVDVPLLFYGKIPVKITVNQVMHSEWIPLF